MTGGWFASLRAGFPFIVFERDVSILPVPGKDSIRTFQFFQVSVLYLPDGTNIFSEKRQEKTCSFPRIRRRDAIDRVRKGLYRSLKNVETERIYHEPEEKNRIPNVGAGVDDADGRGRLRRPLVPNAHESCAGDNQQMT